MATKLVNIIDKKLLGDYHDQVMKEVVEPLREVVGYEEERTPYGYVDLGLPSGLLWASCNIGAENPEDAGLYFSWGNVDGHTAEEVENGDYSFDSGTYAETAGAQLDGDIPVNETYDAARKNLGGNWRMPTKEEFQELINNCTFTWTQRNGVNGYLVTGSNNNSIFLPASGCCDHGIVENRGSRGKYWSSSIDIQVFADICSFDSGDFFIDYDNRNYGYPIRPVTSNPKIGGKSTRLDTLEEVIGLKKIEQKYHTVDLGLPSGKLWADKNVGAENEEDAGLYFSWGNVDGHTAEEVENGDYEFSGEYDNEEGWIGGTYAETAGAQLDGDIPVNETYDAARANMGSAWRMPTKEEFQELNTYCTWELTERNGVSGCLATGQNGNSIFFPLVGSCEDSVFDGNNSWCEYWSSNIFTYGRAYELDFNNGDIYPEGYHLRHVGNQIRAISTTPVLDEYASKHSEDIEVLGEASEELNEQDKVLGNAIADVSDQKDILGYVALDLAKKAEILGKSVNKLAGILADSGLKKVTYSELKDLRDNGELEAGKWYRITDFSEDGEQASFDILVLALDEKTLCEDAKAIRHAEPVIKRRIYKTQIEDFPDEVDYGDWFDYVGTFEFDGQTYYRWQKYEEGEEVPYSILTTTIFNEGDLSLDNPSSDFIFLDEDELYSARSGEYASDNLVKCVVEGADSTKYEAWSLKYSIDNVNETVVYVGNDSFYRLIGTTTIDDTDYLLWKGNEAAKIHGYEYMVSEDSNFGSALNAYDIVNGKITETDVETIGYLRVINKSKGVVKRVIDENNKSWNGVVAKAVDLGLPSGRLWADRNIGADSPEEFGLYFSWGNTDGHNFNEEYPFSGTYNDNKWTSGSYSRTNGSDLLRQIAQSKTYDAARANMGGSWRMPSKEDFQELYDNCTSTWTTRNGVNGRLFTGSNGNSIFLPAAGYCEDGLLIDRVTDGYYWSSSVISGIEAFYLSFNSGNVNPQNNTNRNSGSPIRAIQ